MCCIITVKIKDDDGKLLKKDFQVYETFHANQDDPIIKGCVEDLLKEFNTESSDIDISVNIKIEFV